MKKLFSTFIALTLVLTASFAQVTESVSWSKEAKSLGGDSYALNLTATIDAGWHIYDIAENENVVPTAFTFTLPEGVTLDGGVTVNATPITHEDSALGTYAYYEDEVTFTQKVKVATKDYANVTVNVAWMACDDTNCTPPTDEDFNFEFNKEAKAAAATATKVEKKSVVTESKGDDEKSLWATIIEAILWGFAALLTPCVFPMVPMTVSFFMKGNGSKAKGRTMAMIFGLSIIALYTLPIIIMIALTMIIGGDSMTADIFNWLATHWLPNCLFFAIFMIFAASFFGAFEIVMPSWLVNKSDEQSDKGGLIGVFFMALTLVLVSFSCTGPIVGAVLVKSTTQGGGIFEPIVTMLAFSTAFAIPFTLFAFFPSLLKNLPKSGGWMNTVKVVLGFIEVALGFKFLSVADQTYHWGLLDREVYIAIWIVTFFLLGLYLLGKIQFAHDTPEPYLKVKKLFMAIGVFSFVVYLIPGMWGAPLSALSGYLPPIQTHSFNLQNSGGGAAVAVSTSSHASAGMPAKVKYDDILHHPPGLHGFFDLAEATEFAKQVNKPLFVDFTGHGCVNCREMEANVLADERVKKIINEEYVFVSLYVDDKLQLPEEEWVVNDKGKTLKTIGRINANYQIVKYVSNAQPYYVTTDTDADATMLSGPVAYDKDVQKFIDFLEAGVKAYKAKH